MKGKNMLDKILNNDQFKALNESTKAEIESAFNEAIEVKAAEIAREQIELEKIQLVEDFKSAKEEFETELTEQMDEFIEECLGEIKESIEQKLDESIDIERSKAMLDIFDNLVECSSVDLIKVNEQALNENAENYNELKERYDELFSENYDLKKEVERHKVDAMINEATEGMNLVEREKFKSLAGLLEVNSELESKLKVLAESVKSKKSDGDDDDDDDDEDGKNKEDLKESTKFASRSGSNIDWSKF